MNAVQAALRLSHRVVDGGECAGENFQDSKLIEVELASLFAPNVTRPFSDLNSYVVEIMDARVFGGVHFRQSALVAKKMGEQVAEFVVNNYLMLR